MTKARRWTARRNSMPMLVADLQGCLQEDKRRCTWGSCSPRIKIIHNKKVTPKMDCLRFPFGTFIGRDATPETRNISLSGTMSTLGGYIWPNPTKQRPCEAIIQWSPVCVYVLHHLMYYMNTFIYAFKHFSLPHLYNYCVEENIAFRSHIRLCCISYSCVNIVSSV